MHFEIDQVAPVCHPCVERQAVVCLHHLLTPLKLMVDPARYINQTLGSHTAAIPKPAVDRGGIFIFEMLDHHE